MPKKDPIEAARTDPKALDTVRDDILADAALLELMGAPSEQLSLLADRLRPLGKGYTDEFKDLRHAIWVLGKTLSRYDGLRERADNKVYLGNLAVERARAAQEK